MFQRIGNGIELIKQSARVLSLDKELLFFPLCSAIVWVLVAAGFIAPLWGVGYFDQAADHGGGVGIGGYLLVFAFYVATYAVAIFFNAAIVECAVIRFRGGDPTVADGLKGAAARLPQILGWAVVAATVGMILRALEERAGFVGRLVVGVIGLAWSAGTFFVVPVIVMERLGPMEAIRRSTAIVRQTWAESLSAHMGIGLVAGVFYFLSIAMIVGGVFVVDGSPAIGGVIIGCGVAAFVLVALCAATLQAIVTGALYMYAGQGIVPQQFDQHTLDNVFSR